MARASARLHSKLVADYTSSGRLSFISRDTIELMPIAALMSAKVNKSLGSNLKIHVRYPRAGDVS
jgi:hypothetical protein